MDKKDTRVIVKRILKDYIYQHKAKLLVSFLCMALIAGATATNAWLTQLTSFPIQSAYIQR